VAASNCGRLKTWPMPGWDGHVLSTSLLAFLLKGRAILLNGNAISLSLGSSVGTHELCLLCP
jgi:hypothetical protein